MGSIESPPRPLPSERAESRGAARGSFAPWGAGAGLAAPVLLAAVFAALTPYQSDYLRSIGWSPIRRSAVEWPSVLELGRGGWLEMMAFVVAGPLGIVFAASLFAVLRRRIARIGAGALMAMSLAVPFMAFAPDPPGTAAASWQAAIHNNVYPLIPLSAMIGGVCLAIGLGAEDRWGDQARLAAGFAGVGAVALALTEIDAIAQLARYFFFGPLLVWNICLARGLLRKAAYGP